jgi:hypothetical protein
LENKKISFLFVKIFNHSFPKDRMFGLLRGVERTGSAKLRQPLINRKVPQPAPIEGNNNLNN